MSHNNAYIIAMWLLRMINCSTLEDSTQKTTHKQSENIDGKMEAKEE